MPRAGQEQPTANLLSSSPCTELQQQKQWQIPECPVSVTQESGSAPEHMRLLFRIATAEPQNVTLFPANTTHIHDAFHDGDSNLGSVN